jgi:peptidoglycan/xylan/chitin deacetylase (PgdA/CDA1 family)
LSRITHYSIKVFGLLVFLLVAACGGPSNSPGVAATATAIAQPKPTLTPAVLMPAQLLVITPTTVGTMASASTTKATPVASYTVDARTTVPILMYHQIKDLTASATQDDLAWTVTPAALDAQLGYLSEKGYTTISLDQLMDGFSGKVGLPVKSIVITFDDGWKTQYTVALPLLKKYKQTATFYVVSTYMGYGAYFDWDMTKALKDAGMTIAGHTLDHSDLVKMNATELDKQLRDSKAAIEKNLGITVNHFAYPFGSYNDAVVAAVKRAGYRTAATINPIPVKSPVSAFLLPRMHATYKQTLAEFIKMLP